jgi:hypothetical protein
MKIYQIELKKASLNLLKISLFQTFKRKLLFTNLSILKQFNEKKVEADDGFFTPN